MASDINLPWGGDLTLTASGDISTVSGGTKVFQRVIRRFLTNPQKIDTIGRVSNIPDYLFHPDYGGGAREYVDNPTDKALQNQMSQSFSAQATAEAGVATDPASTATLVQQGSDVIMSAVIYLADSVTPTVGNVRLS